jgi:uncharacterized protein YndB with AHSA1/START domain
MPAKSPRRSSRAKTPAAPAAAKRAAAGGTTRPASRSKSRTRPVAKRATKPAARAAAKSPAKAAAGTGLTLLHIPSLADLMPASDAAVRRATGKTWGEWLAELDKLGARQLPHKAIAQLLSVRLGVPDWWSQMVTVGYERALGRRAVNQKSDGFAASVSRTISAAAEKAFDAWIDPELRKRWLPETVAVRSARRPRSLRISWSDGARTVAVFITSAGERKSRVQIEQGKLKSKKEVEQAKDAWAERLEALAHLLGR